MFEKIVLAFAIALIFVVIWSAYRGRSGAAAGSRHTDKLSANGHNGPYAAVSVHTFRGGCPAAEKIKGQRFLVNDAPMLPLADCKWSKCNCRYTHHSDRRTGTGNRRREAEAAGVAIYDGDNRRDGRGRRASDWIAPSPAASPG